MSWNTWFSLRGEIALVVAETVTATRKIIRYTFSVAPIAVPSLVFLSLLEGFLPVAALWIVKMVIDEVLASSHDANTIYLLIGAFFCVGVLTQVITAIRAPLGDDVSQRLDSLSRRTLLAKVNEFSGIRYFEIPEFHNLLENAEKGTGRRFYAVVEMIAALTRSFGVLGTSAVMLGQLNWWLGLVVIAGILPQNIVKFRTFARRAELFKLRAHDAREQDYYADLITSPQDAKEVRAFGLGDYLLERYTTVFSRVFDRYREFRIRATWHGVIAALFAGSVSSGAFAWIVVQAYHGRLTTGDAVLYIGLLPQLMHVLSNVVGQLANFYITALMTRHFFDFLDLPDDLTAEGTPTIRSSNTKGYEFQNVTFRYPGSDRPVVENISFHIEHDQRVALVGRNGAGKSTIVKLLLRFYDPDEGSILLDGKPLDSYDINELRRKTSVVFQDFAKFYMTVYDNIALGDVSREPVGNWIKETAAKAQTDGFITELPHGYDTMLGKLFDGGTELSGGQWQRIALARAFARDAEMIVLDEPSAALDPQAEYDLFQRFHDLTAERSALLVTHRLGSIRMTDHVLVLKNGKLVESGSHDALMKLDGEYATLYRMQADSYTT
jgi:ATP-binding cassette, subfamily B, bacterial